MRHISEERRRATAEAFLAGVSAVKRQAPVKEERSPAELSERSRKVLFKAALEPGVSKVEIYSSLGMHASEGKRALDDLLARGMVRLHSLARKGRGGQRQVVEVLKPGVLELKRHGLSPAPKKVGRGGFLHDVYAREVERVVKAEGCRQVWFERKLGEKAFDLVVERSDGDLIGYEICLSGSGELNSGQLLKAAGVAGIARVVGCFADRKLMKRCGKALEDQDGLGLFRERIELRHLGEFVDG